MAAKAVALPWANDFLAGRKVGTIGTPGPGWNGGAGCGAAPAYGTMPAWGWPPTGGTCPAAKPTPVRGIAFDSGNGIRSVEFSTDGGASWRPAGLGADLGKYGFRQWSASFTPVAGTSYQLSCRATSNAGETQSQTAVWNPGGYLRNVPEIVTVTA